MNFETLHQPSINISGPTIKTSHATAAADVSAFWAKTDVPSLFAHAQSAELFAAYYNMDPATGTYEMMIGIATASDADLPEEWETVKVAESPYVATTLENAEAESIVGAWQYIWGEWDGQSDRAFGVDFERYVEVDGTRQVQIRLSMKAA